MDAETRAVIERLVEASIESAFKWSATEEESAKLELAIDEARKLLEDDDWIRVEDALPVVPDGEKGVDIAVVDDDGDVIRTYWPARKTCFIGRYSHWKYDPQPQPPEGTK